MRACAWYYTRFRFNYIQCVNALIAYQAIQRGAFLHFADFIWPLCTDGLWVPGGGQFPDIRVKIEFVKDIIIAQILSLKWKDACRGGGRFRQTGARIVYAIKAQKKPRRFVSGHFIFSVKFEILKPLIQLYIWEREKSASLQNKIDFQEKK